MGEDVAATTEQREIHPEDRKTRQRGSGDNREAHHRESIHGAFDQEFLSDKPERTRKPRTRQTHCQKTDREQRSSLVATVILREIETSTTGFEDEHTTREAGESEASRQPHNEAARESAWACAVEPGHHECRLAHEKVPACAPRTRLDERQRGAVHA